jgi:hypothetical protein
VSGKRAVRGAGAVVRQPISIQATRSASST